MSSEVNSTIGDEVVLRVQKTRKGCKVIKYDGRGFRENIFTKTDCRYLYGDDADEKAADYAHKVKNEYESARVVELGEKI